MTTPYSDSAALARYVFEYYGRFCTEIEAKTWRRLIGEWKAEHCSDPKLAQFLSERLKQEEDLDVTAALADGVDAFYRRTGERIVRDHGSEIFINRCPECNRVVETPLACQCFWCGRTWFERRGELRRLIEGRGGMPVQHLGLTAEDE